MMATAGAGYPWVLIVLGSLLGLVAAIASGVVLARALSGRRGADRRAVGGTEPPGLREAQASLRLRYARGEISREDYLQGKVELDD
jgi:putative membrane protein